MKKLAVILCFILIIFLQACDYGILYDKAQPDGVKNLVSFPISLIGMYNADSAKVTILIDPNRIIKISHYDIAASRAEIDTMPDCKLVGDSLYLVDLQKFIYVKTANDSIFGVFASPDTLFTLSDKNILRNLKNYYFLSIAHESGYWQVIKLKELKKGIIEFSVVPQKADYHLLNDITPVKQLKDQNDSILNYHINPSVKELKTMIRSGMFSRNEIYHR